MEYTIADIYALPDGERAELLDGKIYYMALPDTRHQMLVSDFIYRIRDHISRNHGECVVFPAPFAVFINQDERNYVEPDISVICDKNKITDRGCNGAPDWVIEIVSPSTISRKKMGRNTPMGRKCRRASLRDFPLRYSNLQQTPLAATGKG